MTGSITHTKVNNIAAWTQTDLDAQIALGNFPPGTLLADIVLSTDWNAGHTFNLTTADIPDSSNKRYITDAEVTVLSNTSGSNTGDQNLAPYATINSPTFTGTPNAPTPTALDNSTKVATTAYVDAGDAINAGMNNNFLFGNGSDGNVTISSGTTSAGRDMYYNNLTLSGTGVLNVGTHRIFVAGILDISNAQTGAIISNGSVGSNASSNAGAAGGAGPSNTFHTVPNANTGGTGANGSTTNGSNSSGPGNQAYLYATDDGHGGAGGAGGTGTGGTGATATFPTNGGISINKYYDNFLSPIALIAGAPSQGGGGGGGDGINAGGGGGGGGGVGGFIQLSAKIIARGTNVNAGIIQSIGGGGGNGFTPTAGNAGGGGGASGGGGGSIIIYYASLTGSVITNCIDVTGGNGGNGGSLHGTGAAANGNGGGGGPSGFVGMMNLTTGSASVGAQNPATAAKTGGTTASTAATQTRVNL